VERIASSKGEEMRRLQGILFLQATQFCLFDGLIGKM
jgi:hypothetical protein